MQQQINIVWFMVYVMNKQFQVYFFTNYWIAAFTFLMSNSISWKFYFNVSFSFGHDDKNHLRWSVILIWLKIDFQKYLRPRKSKKNAFPKTEHPGFAIWDNWVFDNLILADETVNIKLSKQKQLAETLRSPKACVLVSNNIDRNLGSSLDSLTSFDERFKITSIPFFTCDFNMFKKKKIKQKKSQYFHSSVWKIQQCLLLLQ